jgi:hypothetical protein
LDPTNRDKRKIQAMEMKLLRSTEGKTKRDSIRNETLREKVGIRKCLTEL